MCGYGIRSYWIPVNNIDGTVYLGDIPVDGSDKGKLVLFKLDNNQPLVVKSNNAEL